MTRIQFTKEQEKEIIEAIVNAGEVEFFGSRKWFSLTMKDSNKGKHLSKTKGLRLHSEWNQIIKLEWKKLFRNRDK